MGGGAKPGETPEQTAVREFTEESNCAYALADLNVEQLKGPSISPGVPFHLYSLQVPFKSIEEIAKPRQCADIERSQWVWVRHIDLMRALNQTQEGTLTVPSLQGNPTQVPLWDRGAESLKKAVQDGVLPEAINCNLTQFS